MAQRKQQKKVDLSLGPKYGLGPVISREQAYETFKKAASMLGKQVYIPEEVLEEEYQGYLDDYEKELKERIKAQKSKKQFLDKSFITPELLEQIPQGIKNSYEVIVYEVCKLLYEKQEYAKINESAGESLKQGEETLQEANRYFAECEQKAKEAEEKIAKLETENKSLKLGNDDLITKLQESRKSKLRFVMIKPDYDLGSYIKDLEEANDQLSKECDIYREYYDKCKKAEDDLHTAEQVCNQYEEENEKLRIENQKLHGKIMSQEIQLNSYKDRYGNRSLINYGDETDVYSGEIKDLVIDCLAQKYASCEDVSSRQAILLRDLLEANEKDGTRDEIRRFLFDLFKDYKGYTTLDTAALAEHGLEVSKGSKHAEVYFKDYPKVQAPISVTPSDNAHMQNMAATIAAKLL